MISKDREYRAFEFEKRDDEMVVEGMAAAFNSPTTIAKIDGVEFYEVIDARAFDTTNMSDVVFVADHQGRPAARTKNGTLELSKTEQGLFVRADLSRSSVGPDMFNDIKNGVFDKMSFAFTVRKDAYDKQKRTRTILEIDRLYDVSAVTFPAYEQTSINARSFYEAEAEVERRELLERENKIKRLKLLLELEQKGLK